jgi:hypothetical protein
MKCDLEGKISRFYFLAIYETLEPHRSCCVASFSSDGEISTIFINDRLDRVTVVSRLNLTGRVLGPKS